MAITSIKTGSSFTNLQKYDNAVASNPPLMAAPTATDGGTGSTASVAFTTVTGATSYGVISSPGSFTATGASSPITVSGLSSGTAYTFQVRGINSTSTGPYSAASNSVTPVNPSSYESIASASLSGVSTISFTSIPSTYKSLQLRFITTNNIASYIRFNTDSTTGNYNGHYLWGDGSSVYASSASALTNTNRIFPGLGPQTATNPYVGIIDIVDYASTTKNKTVRNFVGQDNNDGTGRIFVTSGLWLSTSAITTIEFFSPGSNFAANSAIALYGIKG